MAEYLDYSGLTTYDALIKNKINTGDQANSTAIGILSATTESLDDKVDQHYYEFNSSYINTTNDIHELSGSTNAINASIRSLTDDMQSADQELLQQMSVRDNDIEDLQASAETISAVTNDLGDRVTSLEEALAGQIADLSASAYTVDDKPISGHTGALVTSAGIFNAISTATENVAYISSDISGVTITRNFDVQADTVWNKPQDLTPNQKKQARANIGLGVNGVIDLVPVSGSTNMVYSDGIYGAISAATASNVTTYDVSANHRNSNNSSTFSLAEAIALVPEAYHRGGLKVTFISDTTGRYVEWLNTASGWTTNTSYWIGADGEVSVGEKNLVNGDVVARTFTQNFGLIRREFPILNTSTHTFTIPAGARIIKQGRSRLYDLSEDVVFNGVNGTGNYLVYDLSSGTTRNIAYDEAVVLNSNEVIIAYVRWGSYVTEGRFAKYYLDGVLVDLTPDKTIYNTIQGIETNITNNATAIDRNKFILSTLQRYTQGLTDEVQGTFVQAGTIHGDGSLFSVSDYSIYSYDVTEGQRLFICSRLASDSVISDRAFAYAYNDDTPVESVLTPTKVRFDYTVYTVPSGVNKILVYNSDAYGQYVGVIASDGEIDNIKLMIDALSARIEEVSEEVVTEVTYDANDVYKDGDGYTYYFRDLSGGIGTTVPSPTKASSFGNNYYATTPPIEVRKGDVVIISSQTRGTTGRARLWAFTDGDLKILDVAGSEDMSTIDNPLKYTVQEDGYCFVNVSPKTISGFYIKVTHNRIEVIENEIYALEERTDTLEEFVDTISFDDVVAYSAITNEYINYSSGTTTSVTSATRKHDIFNVVPGDVYSIKCLSIGSIGAVVSFFDAGGNYIKESSIQGQTDTLLRIEAIVPNGAATMHLCYIYGGSTGGIELYIKKALGCPINSTAITKAAVINVTDVDAQSANPLEVLKETGGYTAIFHRIAVIGGSMATGAQDYDYDNYVYDRDNASKKENSVIQRMAAIYGGTAYNFSQGGMSARAWLNSSTVGGQSQDFINSGGAAGVDGKLGVQAYFIQVGNNDLNYHYDHPEYVLGTIADVNIGNESSNPDTYYGNLSKIVGRIRDVNPKAYVFFVTFVRGYNNQKYGYNPPADFDYNAAIREVYQAYRADSDNVLFNTTPVVTDYLRFLLLDYYTYGKDWQYFRTGIHDKAYNHTHLSPMGYQYQAYEFCTYVDWLIKNDMKYFDDVQWIDNPGRRTRNDA